MRPLLSLLTLALLLPSCSVLQGAKRLNQSHYAARELKRISSSIEQQEPTYTLPATLYLTDDHGVYRSQLSELIRLVSQDHPTAAQIALLMGDGDALLAHTQDTILMANGYLLQGNYIEAAKLMDQYTKEDLATSALVELRRGRVMEAADQLQSLIDSHHHPTIQLRAARLLSLLSEGGYAYLHDHSPSEWERYMASTHLGNRAASNLQEQTYLSYVLALEQPDSLLVKEAAQRLLSTPAAAWRNHALQHILPQVIAQEQWVELYKIAQQLPELSAAYPIHYGINRYEREVQVMARYEAPEKRDAEGVMTTPRDGSFRSVWGNVSNVDNWVMEHSNYFIQPTLSARPTAQQYEAAKATISQGLKASHIPPMP